MLYFLPFITFMFLTNLNAAIGLYWMTTTVFSIGQQYLMDHPLRFNNKNRFLLENDFSQRIRKIKPTSENFLIC